jgi:hypothetical protein
LAKKKYILDFEPEIDFAIIGIASHQKHYKLTWAINKQLDWQMHRAEDISFKASIKQKQEVMLCLSEYAHDLTGCEYLLVENKKDKHTLLPEFKQADYLLLIRGPYDDDLITQIITQLKLISLILLVFKIEAQTVLNKQNLNNFL